MKSLRVVLFAIVLAVVGLATTAAGVAPRGARTQRWDLVNVNIATKQITPGGLDTSKDAQTSDSIALTGSGQFTPSRRVASGGGTFLQKHMDGTGVSQGFYYVTGFRSYRFGGGTPPKGFADRVAGAGQGTPRDGILIMTIRLIPVVNGTPQSPLPATLRVNCAYEHNHLGLKDSDEGVELRTGNFDFKPVQVTPQTDIGATVFHRLR
jgi:hypothetical protein